ncbi:MAG: efflux RND transporter periplasmic adaptor subunit [Planctomycetia bacterium]|nr:efflux RND transporter periplasmic adaptor subunit [Planctomycetia bacterium]
MTADAPSLPRRRDDLIIQSVGTDEFVVKEPATGAYFRVGAIEHFLLTGLDGQQTGDELRASFRREFGDDLGAEELEEFLELARSRGLVDAPAGANAAAAPVAATVGGDPDDEDDEGDPLNGRRQSLLYWRKSLFDPDWLFTQLEPLLGFVWTPAFVCLSAAGMLCALGITIANWHALWAAAPSTVSWESAIVAWSMLIAVTMLHESAHGLTCKHFGGEVREVGVLFVFFTPCLFCNVSDAWLIPQKSRRLWVTAAGGYCDLCVWTFAVFFWRLTMPGTLPNYLAWILVTVCGTRIVFNLNPLSRMDGYYLISDWFEAPNLRPRAAAYWSRHVRWLLCGAPRPQPEPQGRVLLAYGFGFWVFATFFLYVLVANLLHWAGQKVWGMLLGTFLTTLISKRVFKGFFDSEFINMLTTRKLRTTIWVAMLSGGLFFLFAIPWRNTATGNFQVRSGIRSEVHASVPGFIEKICTAEGDRLEVGGTIAELRVSDVESLIVRKQAEIRECEANLAKLRAGSRPEQIAEQRSRIARAEAWRDLARQDLNRARLAFEQDLLRIDLEMQQVDTELEYARGSVALSTRLYEKRALAGETLRGEKKRLSVLEMQRAQGDTRRKARETEGVRAAEEEVVRREKEVAETKAALALLEAGSRPEEIEAETARRARLQEEFEFLQTQQTQLTVKAPAAGIVSTPRLAEKVGEYVDKGTLICVIEDQSTLQVEIVVREDEVQGIAAGQTVDLKARALPFDTFTAVIDRIAPCAVAATNPTADAGNHQNSVVVYCHVDNHDLKLKSGMTGFARIDRGRKTAGAMLITRGLKYLRTEFWW